VLADAKMLLSFTSVNSIKRSPPAPSILNKKHKRGMDNPRSGCLLETKRGISRKKRGKLKIIQRANFSNSKDQGGDTPN